MMYRTKLRVLVAFAIAGMLALTACAAPSTNDNDDDDGVSTQIETVAGLKGRDDPGKTRYVDGQAFGYRTTWAVNKVPPWVLPANQPVVDNAASLGATAVKIRYHNDRVEVALEDMCLFADRHKPFDPNAIIYDQRTTPSPVPKNPDPTLIKLPVVAPKFVWFLARDSKDVGPWKPYRADPKHLCKISSLSQLPPDEKD